MRVAKGSPARLAQTADPTVSVVANAALRLAEWVAVVHAMAELLMMATAGLEKTVAVRAKQ